MKDGIIKDNGTSRAIRATFPATYEEFKAQAESGTLLLDLLINAEGWSQLPTFLNKANLLDDNAEQQLWGTAGNRTLTEAFIKLYLELKLPRLVTAYTTAGSYRWTVPKTGKYIAVIIGAGGGGGAAINGNAAGGGSGYVSFWFGDLISGDTVDLAVGKGGQSKTIKSGYARGNSGEPSSFNTSTADGGEGGSGAEVGWAANGGRGGQPAASHADYGPIPMGGVTVVSGDSASGITVCHGTPIPAIFLDENGLPISCLCAGGNAVQTKSRTLPNGKTMSPGGTYSNNEPPTDCGAGGGARVAPKGESINSVPGADGGVFIYRLIGGTA